MTIKYRVARDPVTGAMSIMAREAGSLPFNEREFPVALFSKSDDGFPLDPQQLAENITDALLNFMPRHTLSSGGQAVFYTATETGIIFKTRQPGEQSGVSSPAVTLLLNEGSGADMGRDMLARMGPDFMKKICDTIVPDGLPTPGSSQKGPTGMHL